MGRRKKSTDDVGTTRKVERNGRTSWAFVVELPRDPVTGKRRQRRGSGFKTETDAKAALNAVRREIASGRPTNTPDRLTVAELVAEWLEHKRPDVRPTTLAGYRNHLATHVLGDDDELPRLRDIQARDVTAAHVQELLDALGTVGGRSGDGLSRRTL